MASLSSSQQVTLTSVLNGSALSQIQDLNRQAKAYAQSIIDLQLSGKNTAAAEQSLVAMRQNMLQAAAAYDSIAGWIQTITGDNITRSNLTGLGIIDPWTIAAAAALAVGIALMLDKLATTLAAAQGKSIETRGYIDQIGGAIKSTSSLVGTIGIVAAVGFGLYVVYQVMKKRQVV